jgi:hydrogenase expression/formation protein HypC
MNPEIGNYVIVHAGYAIEQMNEKEAMEALEQWKEIAEDRDLDLSDML